MKFKNAPLIILVVIAAAVGIVFKDKLFVDREALSLSPDAQFSQGEMFEHGWGRSRSARNAIKWYELAAESNHTEAQFRLASMYYAGEIVQQDLPLALKWYMQAANNGHVDAEYQVGWMYQHGEGVSVDRIEAEKWFSLAREQGHDKVPPKPG